MSDVLSDVFSVLSIGPHVHVQGGVHQTDTGVLWHRHLNFLRMNNCDEKTVKALQWDTP